MEIHSFIIHLLLFFHVIYLVSVQDLNIIKIGGANFANVNLFCENDITLMGTSGLPYSNEKILYDIGNSFSIIFTKLIVFIMELDFSIYPQIIQAISIQIIILIKIFLDNQYTIMDIGLVFQELIVWNHMT